MRQFNKQLESVLDYLTTASCMSMDSSPRMDHHSEEEEEEGKEAPKVSG